MLHTPLSVQQDACLAIELQLVQVMSGVAALYPWLCSGCFSQSGLAGVVAVEVGVGAGDWAIACSSSQMTTRSCWTGVSLSC